MFETLQNIGRLLGSVSRLRVYHSPHVCFQENNEDMSEYLNHQSIDDTGQQAEQQQHEHITRNDGNFAA